jgi:NADP-dependent 3-hydroxy acid dehydrogenase YdfG
MDLKSRRVLVTGATSGIGEAVVCAMTAAGAAVAAVGRREPRLREIAADTGANPIVADLRDPVATAGVVEAAAEALGGLDCLVNNAGVMLHSPVSAGRADDWRESVEVNILALLDITARALPLLRAAGNADIVNVGSPASAAVRTADYTVYSATKAAVARITEGVRVELTGSSVRVCLVNPGFVNTQGFGPGIRDEQLRAAVVARKEAAGLPPSAVADQICHVVALDRHIQVPEIWISPFP